MIKLPDGTAYTFNYESFLSGSNYYYTGRIASLGLPSGETIYYTYTGANQGISCTDGSTIGLQVGTSNGTWTYSRSGSQTTVTDPKLSYDSVGNQTVYTFDSNGHETQRQIWQGSASSGTLLRTINTTWASNGTPATTVTILEDSSTQSRVDTTYNSYGLLTSRTEYDWGTGTVGSKLRQSTFAYVSDTNTNYSSRNLMNLLSTITIQDVNGTIQYRKDMAYDGVLPGNCPSGVTHHDDANYPCSNSRYSGNPTSVTTYLAPSTNPPSQPVTKNFTYDIFGNQLTAQLNCCQVKTWSYSSTTTYTLPDSVTSGSGTPQLTAKYTYNLATGSLATIRDPNNLLTQYGYDSVGRPIAVTRPDGTTVTIAYNAGSSLSYNGITYTSYGGTTTTTPLDATHSISETIGVDNLGRPQTVSVPGGMIMYAYDALSRRSGTSNPYAAQSPSYWTTRQYDALGRPTKTILPDGQQTLYSYSLQTATVTDPTGRSRKGKADAAGRILIAFEPDVTNGNALTQQTSYTYDVLNDLTAVTQGQQTRTYVYDALGRLISAQTPEANSVATTFTYDNFDNLLTRTDPRGVVTNHTYDGLNRLIGVTYPTVPQGVSSMPNVCTMQGLSQQANVCFYYDQGGTAAFTLGKLTQMADPSGSETYTYDNMGRTTQLQKLIGTTTYTRTYQYNYAGELTQIQYPSGRQVKPSYDMMGRLASIADTMGSTSTTYASGFTYNVAQELTGLTYGNGVTAALTYSADRLQLASLAYTSGTTALLSQNYSYVQNGGSNGQITGIADNLDNGRSATYTYDGLARLTAATTVGSTNYPQWGLSWTYDRYGNRTAQGISSGCVAPMSCPTNSVTVDPTTNRINTAGYSYDANGNMTGDGQNTLVYDGENRVTNSSGGLGSGAYTYDGNGLRVKRVSGATTTVYVFSGSKVIAEYVNGAAPASPAREYIYSSGALIAKIENGTTQYYHQDQLSVRLMTDASGNKIGEQGHYPYGEQWYAASTTTKWQYTTYERDAESNNDYAMAREYVNRLGRFDALDPVAGATSDPQTLNKYPYAGSDPVNNTDPSGQCFAIDGSCMDDGAFGPVLNGFTQYGISSDLIVLAINTQVEVGSGSISFGGVLQRSYSYYAYLTGFVVLPTVLAEPDLGGLISNLKLDLPISQVVPGAKKLPDCFAQLKYRPVDDWRAKASGRTHAFWYVQGSSGSQYIISGGPSNPNGSGSLNVGLNPNVTRGVDNTSATVWWNSGLSPENCKGVDAMIAAAQGWPNNTIPYHPVEGPNSDTAAHSLGTAGGFNPSPPPGTMGWNTGLPY